MSKHFKLRRVTRRIIVARDRRGIYLGVSCLKELGIRKRRGHTYILNLEGKPMIKVLGRKRKGVTAFPVDKWNYHIVEGIRKKFNNK